jgi:hypothetical protein
VSVENTWGKPWSFRKVCRSLKMEGVEDVRAGHGGDERREPAVGGKDDGRHDPDRDQDGHDGHADPQGGIDVAQVVPAHGGVTPGPDDAAGVPKRKGGEEDQRHHEDGASDIVRVSAAEERHPDFGPEIETQNEAGEGQELDQGAEPQPMDSRQQHQPDDQQVDPIHRCEGSQRCPEKYGPHSYCHRSVPPRPVFRHRRVRRRSGGLFLILGAVAITSSACAFSGHPGPTKVPRVLGESKGATLAVGQPAPSGTSDLGALSCATDRRCWAVGIAGPNAAPSSVATVIDATTNGGLTWKAQQVTGGSTPQLSGVSCPTATTCMAVGSNGASLPGSGVVITTGDAGATWSPAASPQNALVVSSVTCTSTTDCTAIVSDGTSTWSAHSPDFGQSWQQEGTLPAGFLPGNDITCTDEGICIDAGYVPTTNGHGQGAVAVSADGGQSWAMASVPAGTGVLQSTACLSPSNCLAAGTTGTTVSDVVPAKGELLHSADGGHTWVPSSSTLPVDDVYGLACPSDNQCAMVGTTWVGSPAVGTGGVAESTDAGLTFSSSPTSYVPITLTAVACPSTSHCVAVGGNTVARLTLLSPRRHRRT